ncbi:virion structural protein [Vibrio phage K227]
MPRACFKDWSEADLLRLVGKTDSDTISAEDLAAATDQVKKMQSDAFKQAAAIKEGVSVISRSPDAASNLHGMLTRDPNEATNFLSADQRINAIRSNAKANLSEFMSSMAPKFRQIFAGIASGERKLSKEQHTMVDNFVREVFGQQTGNGDAQKAAKGWLKATEDLNTRFGNAGGHMAELDDWRLPQKHDRMAIAAVDADEWVDKIWDKLDHEEMISRLKAKNADIDTLREAMYSAYHNITTDGLSSQKVKHKKLKDLMRNERLIRFKDADSWLEYQQEFGDSNLYASMLSHIDQMGRAIGMMETFGPDPDAGYGAIKRAAKLKDGKSSIRSDSTFELMMGYNAAEEQTTWAQGFATMRNIFTASKLGGAVISALTDTVYGTMAAKYNGMQPAKVLGSMFGEVMKKNTEGKKQWAQDFGFSAEFALDRMVLSTEYLESFGGHRSQNLAESVMQASGMNRWTNSARASFQFEFNTALTRATKDSWDELPDKMRGAMERYGITADDWATLRTSKRSKYKSAELLDPRNLDAELQTKLVGMVDGETMMAVPSPDARTRSFMSMGTKSGTTGGELIRSIFQYHSFPVTAIMNQYRRLYSGKGYGSNIDRYTDAAMMLGALTTLGVGVVQVKEMLAGKEPMKMDDPNVWVKGMAQGGGFSYIGDFVRNAANGFNHDTSSYVGGAPMEYGDFIIRATTDVATGNPRQAATRAANFVAGNVPFNNLWYTKVATDRLIMDRLKRLADPEYDKKQMQKMRKMRKEDQQEYWWSPPIGGR